MVAKHLTKHLEDINAPAGLHQPHSQCRQSSKTRAGHICFRRRSHKKTRERNCTVVYSSTYTIFGSTESFKGPTDSTVPKKITVEDGQRIAIISDPGRPKRLKCLIQRTLLQHTTTTTSVSLQCLERSTTLWGSGGGPDH